MTAKLTRLRIAGFKSFAEPVSLDILPGLTGVVGPNGCGKSNVVEALRWAMGETSARSLRGGEMDDVIFAGTTARASRNLAEVTITLESGGEGGQLPPPFEAESELQVTRRIERGAGSQFRANGREMRARDVQTLYADLASGARSSGMVSQGRVSQLVNAKPEERRLVLEEAAGITGLHARRHEAELKLRAAEQNLTRAEDVRSQLEAAQEGLRKQARQAARYRNISGYIRAAEAEHLGVLHAQAQLALTQARDAQAQAEAAALAAAEEVFTSGEALAEAEAALPAPREAEAQARSLLERRRVEAESLAAESERLAREAAEAETRLLELETDFAAAERARADANASVERLAGEAKRLEERLSALPGEIEAAREAHEIARKMLGSAQLAADDAAAAATEAQALAKQGRLALDTAERRAATARDEHLAASSNHADASLRLVSPERIEAAKSALDRAEFLRTEARAALESAELLRAEAGRATLSARSEAEKSVADFVRARKDAEEAASLAAQREADHDQALKTVRALEGRRVPAAHVDAAVAAASQADLDLADAETRLAAAEEAFSAAQAALAQANRYEEDVRAAYARAEAARQQARLRANSAAAEADKAEQAFGSAERSAPSQADLADAEAAETRMAEAVAAQKTAVAQFYAGQARAAQALAEARGDAAAAEAEAAKIAAEAEGLLAALGDEADSGLFSAIQVPEGLEVAIGVALGDASDASLDPSAQKFFRALPPVAPDIPQAGQRLDALVQAPPALARMLAAIALLDTPEEAEAAQPFLAPGTAAVTRDGGSWRWDGQVIRPGAPNAASIRLRQKNRLQAVRSAREQADAVACDARARCDAAGEDEATAEAFLAEARAALVQAEADLRAASEVLARLVAQKTQAEASCAALRPIAQRATAYREEAVLALEQAEAAFAALPNLAVLEAQRALEAGAADAGARALADARAARAETRTRLNQAQADAARLQAAARDIDQQLEIRLKLVERLLAEMEVVRQAAEGLAAALAALPDPAIFRAALATAQAAETEAVAAETRCRAERGEAEQALDAARTALSQVQMEAVQAESRLAALATTLLAAAQNLEQAEAQVLQAAEDVSALPDAESLSAAAVLAQADLDVARKNFFAAESRLNTLQAEHRQAEAGFGLATQELAAWQARFAEAAERTALLASRRDTARAAWQSLGDAPAAIAARAERSATALEAAEAAHRASQERFLGAEHRVRALTLARRDAELATAARREAALRAEASCEAAAGALAAVLARAAERLGPDAAFAEPADFSDAAEERARKKFERLTRERDEMGPVNLRADLELEELDQRAKALEQEREELGTAIAKLRGSIGHLNREGRARLEAVFTQVDQHFRTLFTRMMGGGRAHLALTGSEDPLLAGLEIYAEPPGKKLAALSLLSGGEQALTALSLIFAVFRCTPAPISVLDEVDAPLDDANVERFCTLLDDVVRDTGTRFLVVTHHQLTMSRMDRLFGVTMQERGISRLLSVDFRTAAMMVEPALQAAE
jgi:chromosome segregation protein